MKQNRYIEDILKQPAVLRAAVENYAQETLEALHDQLVSGEFKRILLTGMGGSYFAAYPTWLRLLQAGLPAWWTDTSELLHFYPELIGPGSLLWAVSQSGASAELLALLDRREAPFPPTVLAVTNHPESPLGQQAQAVLELHAGEEFTVSTGTYTATLAVLALACAQLLGEPLEPVRQALLQTAQAVETYLQNWEQHVQAWTQALGLPERLIIVGRGPSYAAAKTAALITKESAKFPVEGLTAAQFRHGPLEMADPRLAVIVLAGTGPAREMNEKLALELQGYGAKVIWLATQPHPTLPSIQLPHTGETGGPVAEILPLQLLTLSLAAQTGVEPGIFRHIGKVTTTE